MRLTIINGPNLNLLGIREKSIYGNQSFEDFLENLKKQYNNIHIDYFQSNSEGVIIDQIHQKGFSDDGIILNAGAYTHTSAAIGDAIAAINTPVVEVHISNVYNREEFRHKSFLSKNCEGIIVGFGMEGYRLAIEYFVK